MAIGALQPGTNTAMVVAIIISKSDPRKVTMKKDGTDRWVTTFTLRDSPSDMINFTIWSGKEEASSLKKNFHIGNVMEVIRPRITQRDLTGRESNFSPAVTSSLQLVFQEGKTVFSPFLGDISHYTNLLRIPSKGSSTFLSISDIVTNSGSLKGHFVDILAAVRSVAEEKKFPSRDGDGEERGVREVRLFDQTQDSLLLKLWDSETIRMAAEWIPRENILFLADVRIDYDNWRGAFVVTATGKTVVTVDPDTREAIALAKHAQMADFSSMSRLDQFVATIEPSMVSRVVNVMAVQAMCEKTTQAKDSMMSVRLYGYITKLDIDCPEAVSLRCGACAGPFKVGQEYGGEMVCVNMECREFNNIRQDRINPSQQFYVRGDISDETGTLASIKISQAMLDSYLGPPAEFAKLSDQTKTAFKWQLVL